MQARAEGKFICTMPRAAKLARSERLCKREQRASLFALCREQPNLREAKDCASESRGQIYLHYAESSQTCAERKTVQARAEGKFICTMPRVAKLARSERLFERTKRVIRLASPTAGYTSLQLASLHCAHLIVLFCRHRKNVILA